jgi:hypothetical protein
MQPRERASCSEWISIPRRPEWQMGDSLRIQQVLVNLLSNALKFTASGRIDVRVKVLEAAAGSSLDSSVASAPGSPSGKESSGGGCATKSWTPARESRRNIWTRFS